MYKYMNKMNCGNSLVLLKINLFIIWLKTVPFFFFSILNTLFKTLYFSMAALNAQEKKMNSSSKNNNTGTAYKNYWFSPELYKIYSWKCKVAGKTQINMYAVVFVWLFCHLSKTIYSCLFFSLANCNGWEHKYIFSNSTLAFLFT